MTVPIWLLHSLCVGIIFAIGGGVVVYSANRESSTALLAVYDSFSQEVTTNMVNSVSSIIEGMREASLIVDVFEPRLATCGEPPVNHTGEVLLRSLTALPGDQSVWLSLGLMQRASAESTAKWSWQMALGFGCPAYIYAYIDAATSPAFLGYCAKLTDKNTLDLASAVAYNGTDWGFTPLEQAMLFKNEYNESFVPVKALLGVLEFSYRRLVSCNGMPFALVFVSRTVAQLDLELNAQLGQSDSVAFVIERDTGLLVAASALNQTHLRDSELRVHASNATNRLIREAVAQLTPAPAGGYATTSKKPEFSDKLYVSVTLFAKYRGVDWLLIVATDPTTIKKPIEDDSAVTLTTVVVTVVITILLVGLVTFLLVTLPVRRLMSAGGRSRPRSWWVSKEMSDIETLLETQKK